MDAPIPEKDWLPVTESMFMKDAEVICDVLEQEGIPAKIVEPNTVQYSRFAPQRKTGQVLVPKQHLERARAVLDAKEKEAES